MSQWVQLYNDLEATLRTGGLGHLYKKLETISIDKIPSSMQIKFANLARRAANPQLALKILQNKVEVLAASDEELVEYCFSLVDFGLTAEVKEKLALIKNQSLPEASMLQIYLCNKQWNYEESLSHAQRYVGLVGTDSYKKMVAELNLASIQIFLGQTEKAAKWLIDHEASLNHHERLMVNFHELMGIIALRDFETQKAIRHFNNGVSFLKSQKLKDSLFLKKWIALAVFTETRDDSVLLDVVEEARDRNHFETLRSIDIECARITKRKDLINKVFYGTPCVALQDKMRQYGPIDPIYSYPQISQSALNFQLGRWGDKNFIDYRNSRTDVLRALTSDFYRPILVGDIFQFVFPQEVFNEGTANKVHNLIYHTRQWLRDEKIPIEIVEEGNAYHIKLGENHAIEKMPERSLDHSKYAVQLRRLLHKYKDQEFKSSEISEVIGVPNKSVNRVLKTAVEEGHLKKSGAARNTFYQLI